MSFTGTPSRCDIAAASATGSESSLLPNPPPIRVMLTVTFSWGDPEHLRGQPAGAVRILGWGPDLGPVPLHVREAVLGLQVRVGDEGIGVRGLDHVRRAGERLVGVAVPAVLRPRRANPGGRPRARAPAGRSRPSCCRASRPASHVTLSSLRALNAAHVEVATMATPGTRPVSWPSGTVRSTRTRPLPRAGPSRGPGSRPGGGLPRRGPSRRPRTPSPAASSKTQPNE